MHPISNGYNSMTAKTRQKGTSIARGRVLSALAAPLDVVIVDEIGPLELEHEEGFAPALDRLPTSRAEVAVRVVRNKLVSQAQTRLTAFHPTRIRVCQQNRDQIPGRLCRTVYDLLLISRD